MSLRIFFTTLIASVFLAPVKYKKHFYRANVVFGVFFCVSVCSVEATLATNEINFL